MDDQTATVPLPGEAASPRDPRDPGAEALERGATAGRYVILARIGAGGMGVVYAAYDPELDRKVALKLLRTDRFTRGMAGEADRLRLLREAQALARLTHPNVVAVHDAGTFGDRVFVAMELVEGKTLRQWLEEAPRSWREVLDHLLPAGRGLAAAHAAGLVHRDFKPENVLIGRDGRVRVVDFGLAKALADAEEPPANAGGPPESGAPLATPLTEWGTVLGTPAYMAPEQLRGIAADARSDQFSFCVALYEALYGERPFAGEGPREIAEAVTRGAVREASAGTRVPGWLREVVLRGLRADPRDRYAAMDDLLRDLGHDPAAVRRRWLAAAAIVLVTGALFSSLGYFQARRARLCGGAEEQIGRIWNASRKQEVHAAFARTGLPFAENAWKVVESGLDRRSRAWVEMRRAGCEATRVRGEQSETLLDRRMFCLDQKLKDTGALVDLLAHADRQIVRKISEAPPGSAGLEDCADTQALMARVPPPRNGVSRHQVEAVQRELSKARALAGAGKEKAAVETLSPFIAAAKATGYRPIEAEVLYYLGFWKDRIGQSREAEKIMLEALYAAQAGSYQEKVGEAASELSWIVGFREARPGEGDQWDRLAQATADGLQADPALRAHLLMGAASLLSSEGKNTQAIATARRALELVENHLGRDHPFAAVLWSNIGVSYDQLGDAPKALDACLRALAIRKKILPADHPDFGLSYNTLGNTYLELHRLDLAEDYFQKAHSVLRDHYGPLFPNTAGTLVSLAIVSKERGRYAEALQRNQEARSVFERNFGRDHPYVSMTFTNDAEIYLLQKRYEEALETYRQSLAIDQKILGATHPDVAYSWQGIGLALRGLGRSREAVEPLSRAVALRQSGEVGPELLAESRWALAQALWESGGDRRRALDLARQAADGFAAVGRPNNRREITDWLHKHGANPANRSTAKPADPKRT
jgi:tetratricopeptide (TPR) repeat protein/predicted Ser/Thr protein kinase